MSYAMAGGLQAGLFDLLTTDVGMQGLVGGAVFDAVPKPAPDLFVALGPEIAEGRSDASGAGAVHEVALSVVTTRAGYADAKAVAARISEVIEGGGMTLPRGRVAAARFVKARARVDEGEGVRRIDMRFRLRVQDD
ncbi:DUF3168 domain-containing protein [Jannaschia sp. Os4]|uniref:DUF3168 domain-containing protein n=1 Tax=Jannaschia sp. Os4 TaxID=2807617 RepID=UPI00193A5EC0|nr:DUF3168 domain-containing protein [Jannaschia sp. Os4]MBM2576814.1 DUF3168 domain-containing protein [Jannaschia sp. Os4]